MRSALPNPPNRHKRITIEPAEAINTREAHAALIRDLRQELLNAPSPGKTKPFYVPRSTGSMDEDIDGFYFKQRLAVPAESRVEDVCPYADSRDGRHPPSICTDEIVQNWLLSWRKPGGTRAPVCGERTAWRVPALGKTMCQKSVLGEANVTPTKRRSRFSRREVTWHSADSAVFSLKMRMLWPGMRGVSISRRAPWALTTYVEASRSMVSPSGRRQRTFTGICRGRRTVRRRSG